MSEYARQLWADLKYDVWRWSHIAPRLRFCKRGRCIRLVVAYPSLRPTLCRKHNIERWLAGTEHIRSCAHERTRPNLNATAVLDMNPRVCLDCGVGIVGPRSES